MKRASLIILAIMAVVLVGLVYGHYRNQRIARQQQKAPQTTVTIIEGWTIKDITAELAKKNLVKAEDFQTALANFDLSSRALITNSKPKNAGLEGYLFPDTYRFNTSGTADQIIGKMLDNFAARMKSIGVTDDQRTYTIKNYQQKLTLYQVLTLASIVEQESGGQGLSADQLQQQREIIAGVFYNRLASGQALESDATINYVTGKNDPSASAEDLKINSPYNTYAHRGLPPGPISNPSLASIRAVLIPQQTDYYYFFHKQPSGEAVYSKTFSEHKRNQQQNGL